MRSAIAYDESYAVDHGHDSEVLGRLKVSSLERWLTRLNLDISELRICEIGFGSGWPLAYMNQHAHAVYGIEAIPENLQSAVRLGVNPSCLFDSSQLPGTLPEPIDLWVYQDGFEHITDVHSHLDWVARNSSPDASALLVLPEASSPSEKIAGRLWPYRVVDHTFHWSRGGLTKVWGLVGFTSPVWFRPLKALTLGHLLACAAHKFGVKTKPGLSCKGPSLWFNVGEQGVLLRRGVRHET